MTTKLEQAARQALEALEFEFGGEPCGTWDAITALREALAEQALQKLADFHQMMEQEPVACIIHTEEGDYLDWNSKGYCFYTGETPLYAAPVRTKDLTDAFINELHKDAQDPISFARAVIAADRGKNK